MLSERAQSRTRERVGRIVGGHLDAESLRLEIIEELRVAIGFDTWGWPLADPVSLLPTTGIADPAMWPVVPRIVDHEERRDDFNRDRDLATRSRPVATLSAATQGDLARSPRWREILGPAGFGDELRAACVDRHGCWGHMRLYRDSSGQPFHEESIALIAEVIGSVASALRRLAATPTPPTTIEPLPSAIVILDEHLAVQSWTANAGPWFDAFAGKLPPVGVNARCAIYAAAAHCLAQPDPDRGGSRVRLRLDDGRWAVADAARLNGIANGVAVSVRQAGISDVLDVLSGAYGLTARERQLVTLVVEGLDTRELATRLFISPNTVQQHLKSVFNKLGVRSRRELVTDIFRQPT